jgi:hypothetical protein
MMRMFLLSLISTVFISSNAVSAKTDYWYLKIGGAGGTDSLRYYTSKNACEKAQHKILPLLLKLSSKSFARCLNHLPPGFVRG